MKKLCVGAVAGLALSMLSLGGPAGATTPTRGAETLTMTINVANEHGPSPATASGVFSGSGTDIRTAHAHGRTDHATDVFTFSGGTVTIKDAGVRRTKTDASTCTRQLAESGLWIITHGTGTFAHARGHGHYKATGTIHGVASTTGCNFTAPTGSISVTASGTVN